MKVKFTLLGRQVSMMIKTCKAPEKEREAVSFEKRLAALEREVRGLRINVRDLLAEIEIEKRS